MMHRTLLSSIAVSLLLWASAPAQTFQSVYSFPGDGTKGKGPEATLILGPGSFLYGTTLYGGAENSGTVFRMATDTQPSLLGSLHASSTGKLPFAKLADPGDGFLYGASEFNDGVSGSAVGTVFKVDPAGGLSTVFQLPGGGTAAKRPRALVATDSSTLQVLGSSPGGLWRVSTNGDALSTYTFGSSADDGTYAFSLTKGSDGKLYGTTEGVGYIGTAPGARGTLFRINADGTGMTKLHDCLYETGVAPHGGMVQAKDGNFYGTMSAGGLPEGADAGGASYKRGVIFRLTPAGDYAVIHYFNGLSIPLGDLMQATDGYLYGTASSGGPSNAGGVFRIATDGSGYQVLQNFTNTNGARPCGGLVQAADGNLYGTTSSGGSGNAGTIFRVTLNLPPANRPPVAFDDVVSSSGGDVIFIPVLNNDFDPEGQALEIYALSSPAYGNITVTEGVVRYDPGIGFPGTDSFTYYIRDPQGLTASATVTIQSTPVTSYVYSGAFNGILCLDPGLEGDTSYPRAQMFVSVNQFGGFSGFLNYRKKRVPFRGVFDLEDGTGLAVLNLPVRKKAILYLSFLQDEEATMVGLVFGREVWSTNARPLAPSPDLTSTRYTVSMVGQGHGTMPQGFGYGTMLIKPSGLVTCVGKYGDGTPVAWGTTLVTAAVNTPEKPLLMPVFSEPVVGGACGGVLDSRANPTDYDFGGRLSWYRPASRNIAAPYASGFTGETLVGVSRYVPKTRFDPISAAYDTGPDGIGVAFIARGALASPITAQFAFDGNSLTYDPPLKQLIFNTATGAVRGKMLNGSSIINFSGVVDQRGKFGVGLFMLNGVAGAMELN